MVPLALLISEHIYVVNAADYKKYTSLNPNTSHVSQYKLQVKMYNLN